MATKFYASAYAYFLISSFFYSLTSFKLTSSPISGIEISFHSPFAISVATTMSYVGADNCGYSSDPSVGIYNNESTI